MDIGPPGTKGLHCYGDKMVVIPWGIPIGLLSSAQAAGLTAFFERF